MLFSGKSAGFPIWQNIPTHHAGVYEEGGPPTDLADKMAASFSNLMKTPLLKLQTSAVAEADKYEMQPSHATFTKRIIHQRDAGRPETEGF